MTRPHDALAGLIAEFEAQQGQLTRMRDDIASASATVTSSRNELTVTVGPSGEVRELRFNNRDYRRMGPEELSTLVTTTLGEARAEVEATVQAALGAVTGGQDTALADMMSGSFDWTAMFPSDLTQQLIDGDRRPGRE